MAALIVTALVLILVIGAVGFAVVRHHASASSHLPKGDPGTGTSSPAAVDSQAEIRRLLIPAVVDINTVNQTLTGYALAAATGMIVSTNGYIVTNNHVVEEATSIKVSIEGHKRQYPATFVGADPSADVAVIKVDGLSDLPTVTFGNSDNVAVGNAVVAIGNALGRGGTPAVTTGSITALGRSISAGDELLSRPEQLAGLIATNATIQSGNSGGPLVDDHAQVIGMNTAADENGARGFALPINRVAAIASAVERGRPGDGVVLGLTAFLGVVGQRPKAGVVSDGVPVTRIVLGDPAARSGIGVGDTILDFNGKPTATVFVLQRLILAERPGDVSRVRYRGPAGVRTVSLRLVAGPAP